MLNIQKIKFEERSNSNKQYSAQEGLIVEQRKIALRRNKLVVLYFEIYYKSTSVTRTIDV